MNILKFGERYINMENVVDVVFFRGNAKLTLRSITTYWLTEDTASSVSETIELHDAEAMALKWWLDTHSHDAMGSYGLALHLAKEGAYNVDEDDKPF